MESQVTSAIFYHEGDYLHHYCFSSSLFADLKILSRIRIPDCLHAALWIYAPLSGFLSIVTYIGKPKFILWPPCLYHLDMDSSSHIRYKGEKNCVRYSLKWVTESPMSFQQWALYILPSPRTSGWCLHLTFLHSISKRCLFILIYTKAGAELYFDWDTVDRRLSLSPNSKHVSRIIIPNHLIITPLVSPLYPCSTNCLEVYSVTHLI